MTLSSLIEQHREQLRSRHPDLARCDVTVEDCPPRRYERSRYNVRLDIEYVGRRLVINREHDNDPVAALGEAFAAAHWTLDAAQASRRLG